MRRVGCRTVGIFGHSTPVSLNNGDRPVQLMNFHQTNGERLTELCSCTGKATASLIVGIQHRSPIPRGS
jgi:hypothetical protein